MADDESWLSKTLKEIHAGIPDEVWKRPQPVRLTLRLREDGGLQVESDIPGLYLSGLDHAAVLRDLERCLRVMWRARQDSNLRPPS